MALVYAFLCRETGTAQIPASLATHSAAPHGLILEIGRRRAEVAIADLVREADPHRLHDICLMEDIFMCSLRPARVVLLALAPRGGHPSKS